MLQPVYFTFNSTEFSEEAKATLERNAEWIMSHPDTFIVIEGHCDDRGSTEYNLALGERRAVSVKKYLVRLGVEPNRLGVVSYGEEKPIAFGRGESDHQVNRRAEFIVRK